MSLAEEEAHHGRLVKVGARVDTVREVDSSTGSFVIHFQLYLQWWAEDGDPEYPAATKFEQGDEGWGCKKIGGASLEFVPEPMMMNISADSEVTNDVIEVADDGSFVRQMSYRGEFFDDQDLRLFPFDVQELRIRMRVPGQTAIHMQPLDMKPETDKSVPIVFNKFFRMSEWRLHCPSISIAYVVSDSKVFGFPDAPEIPNVELKIVVERSAGYYLGLASIVASIVLLAFLGYCIKLTTDVDNGDTANRLNNVLMVMFLSLMAVKFAVAGQLPTVPYETLWDKYVNGCLCILFLMCLQIAGLGGVMMWLAPVHGDDTYLTVMRVGDATTLVFVVGFLLVHVVVAVFYHKLQLKNKRLWVIEGNRGESKYSFVPRLLVSRETLGRIPSAVVNHCCSGCLLAGGVLLVLLAAFALGYAVEVRGETISRDSPFVAVASMAGCLGAILLLVGNHRRGHETRHPHLQTEGHDKLMHFRSLYCASRANYIPQSFETPQLQQM